MGPTPLFLAVLRGALSGLGHVVWAGFDESEDPKSSVNTGRVDCRWKDE